MKKIIVTLVVCVIATFGFSQDRVNREKVSFDKQSEVLTKATGWAYNETLGEWIDYQNVISSSKDFKTTFKTLCGSSYMMSMHSNFNTIQAKTINYEGEQYICLIVNKWSGQYRYPNIREDWYEYKIDDYIVLSKEEYKKLFNLTNDVTVVEGWIQTKYEYDKEISEEDFLISKIKEKKSGIKKYYYDPRPLMQVYKATDGSIRFLFEGPSKYTKGIDKHYFETTEADWNKLKIEL